VLIIDDVISAGTSVRESVDLIRDAGATPVAVVIALDRQERGQGELSAVQEVERNYGIPVISVASLTDLVDYLSGHPELENKLSAVRAYRVRYGTP
jgi:orotate phosphoribosyltransferase